MTRRSLAVLHLGSSRDLLSLGGNGKPTRYARAMTKSTLTHRQLQRLLIERIEALPGMAGEITDVHRAGVRWVDAPPGAPNWTVPTVTERGSYRSDVARVIRQAQMEFDLDVD